MKKLLFCLTAIIAAFTAYSQEPNLKGFTFDKFKPGEIVKKGGKSSVLLNYDEVYHKMAFAKNNEYYYLGDLASVIYVNIDGRTFVPVNDSGMFYEEIDLGGEHKLYVQNISEIADRGVTGAYGGTSQTTATQQITSYSGGRTTSGGTMDATSLKLESVGQLVQKTLFYLKVDGTFKPILSKANLISVLGHKDEINEFTKQNKTNFKKLEDVKKVVGFAYSL